MSLKFALHTPLRACFGGICAAALLLSACNNALVTPKPNDTSADAPAEKAVFDSNVQKLIKAAQDSDVAYSVVESLTTDIGPRQSGSEAEARARDWGVAKFKELGFENVRIEPFFVPGWQRGVETARIVHPFPQPLYITALGGSVATPSGGVTAEIAYFKTFEDLAGAAEDLDLTGKIVYISGRMEKAPDGAGYGPANKKRRGGATEAAKRGAVAVLIRSVGTDSHRFPHTGQMGYAEGAKKIPIAAMSGPDADQMDRILDRGETMTVSMDIGPRELGELPSGNVIGEIVGTEKPEEIVLIGGHLDSWDLGTGALDDGAGIGITVGAAKVFAEVMGKPKRTIRVVMFGSEENGLWGGKAYAQKHKDDLHNHVTATESDFGAEQVFEIRADKNAGSKAFAAKLAKELSGIGVKLGVKEGGGGPDIIAMNAMGVPSVRLQQDGTDYFDFHHTPDDTLDKIDPEKLAQNVAAYAAFLQMTANSDVVLRDAEKNDTDKGAGED